LVVDASGNVGIGTSSPNSIGTGVPTIDLKGNNASQSDRSGGLYFTRYDGTGSMLIAHTDGANVISGLSTYPTVFKTNNTERIRIDSSGNVLINCISYTDAQSGGIAFLPSGGNCDMVVGSTTTNNDYVISFYNPNGNVGNIGMNGSATYYNTSSDYRLKENITEITDGITRVKELNPSRFNFIADPDKIVDGFIAHEVQDIVPEAITGEKDAVNEDGSIRPQGIDQSKLVPLLTAALQESIALIESQQFQIDTLTAKTQEQDLTIASLISRIEALETTP